MSYDNTPNRLESAFIQRAPNNQYYEQINISGSDLVIYHDESGLLTADKVLVWASKYGIGSGGQSLSASWASSSVQSQYATQSISASYAGTASYALNANASPSSSWASSSVQAQYATQSISSSYANYADTSSVSISASIAALAGLANAISFIPVTAISASWVSASVFITTAQTASYVTASNVKGTVLSASNAITASFSLVNLSSSYAATCSVFFYYNVTQSVSSYATQSIYATQSLFSTQSISASYAGTASVAFTSSFSISGSYAATSSYVATSSYASTASFWNSSSVVTLIGTKQPAITTGSTFPITASWATTASYALTSSLAVSSSWTRFPSPFIDEIMQYVINTGGVFDAINGTIDILQPMNVINFVYDNFTPQTASIYFSADTGSTIIQIPIAISQSMIQGRYIFPLSGSNVWVPGDQKHIVVRNSSGTPVSWWRGNSIYTGSAFNCLTTWYATNQLGLYAPYGFEYYPVIPTSSYAVSASSGISSSYALTASLSVSSSQALSASFWDSSSIVTLIGTKQSTITTGSTLPITASWAITSSYSNTASFWDSSSIITLIGTKQNTITTGSTLPITASWAITASYSNTASFWNSSSIITLIGTKQNTITTGSTLPITSSWAITASYAISSSQAISASYWDSSSIITLIGTKQPTITTGSTLPITASWAITASYAISSSQASSASYWDSSSIITLIGTKQATITTGSSYPITASWAITSSYSNTASFWDSSSIVTLIGTKQPTITTGSTLPVTASWAITSSYALTASFWNSASIITLIGTKQNTITTGSTFPITASWAITSSYANTASFTFSSSLSTTASYAWSSSLASNLSGSYVSASSGLYSEGNIIISTIGATDGLPHHLMLINGSGVNDNSFVLGMKNQDTSGAGTHDNIIIGTNNTASNFVGLVAGTANTVIGGEDTYVIGESNVGTFGDQIFGLGNDSDPSNGSYRTIFGVSNKAYSGSAQAAFGANNNAGNDHAMAIGYNLTNLNVNTIEIGADDTSKITISPTQVVFRTPIIGTASFAVSARTASLAITASYSNTASFWDSSSIVTLIGTKQPLITTGSTLPITASAVISSIINVPNGLAGLDSLGNIVGVVLPLQDTEANLGITVPQSGQEAYATDTRNLFIGDGTSSIANLYPITQYPSVIGNLGPTSGSLVHKGYLSTFSTSSNTGFPLITTINIINLTTASAFSAELDVNSVWYGTTTSIGVSFNGAYKFYYATSTGLWKLISVIEQVSSQVFGPAGHDYDIQMFQSGSSSGSIYLKLTDNSGNSRQIYGYTQIDYTLSSVDTRPWSA